MSSVIDGPLSRASTAAAQCLRTTMAAVRVPLSWFGTGKTLTAEQKQEAAEPFSADARFLSAGKRLLDVSPPGLQGGHGCPRQDDRVLEVDEPSLSGAGHPWVNGPGGGVPSAFRVFGPFSATTCDL